MGVEAFLQSEYYQKVLGAIALVVVLSMILERALSVPFEWGLWDKWLERMKLRTPIALVAAWFICWRLEFDLLPILSNRPTAWIGTFTIGTFLTACVIAGGSKGAILLFQGILGFGKDAVDAKVAAAKQPAPAAPAAVAPPVGAAPTQWWQRTG